MTLRAITRVEGNTVMVDVIYEDKLMSAAQAEYNWFKACFDSHRRKAETAFQEGRWPEADHYHNLMHNIASDAAEELRNGRLTAEFSSRVQAFGDATRSMLTKLVIAA